MFSVVVDVVLCYCVCSVYCSTCLVLFLLLTKHISGFYSCSLLRSQVFFFL